MMVSMGAQCIGTAVGVVRKAAAQSVTSLTSYTLENNKWKANEQSDD